MAVRKRAWATRKGEQKTAWVVDYRDQSGKRHIETFDLKKRAVTREGQVRINIKHGTHVAPSESMTVAEADRGQAIAPKQATKRLTTYLRNLEPPNSG
jgi:integrase